MNATTPRPKTRTWATMRHVTAYGEHWGHEVHTVTLTRDAAGQLSAQVDGEAAPVAQAVGILTRADTLTLTAEAYLPGTPAPAPIGKARAARLHRFMGRLGLPSAQHYALAAAALGEWAPVPSLAELSEREARAVWAHLCRLYPQARTLAA